MAEETNWRKSKRKSYVESLILCLWYTKIILRF